MLTITMPECGNSLEQQQQKKDNFERGKSYVIMNEIKWPAVTLQLTLNKGGKDGHQSRCSLH